MAAGELFHTGGNVILWFDPRGYDAYRPHRFFAPEKDGPSGAPDRIARYGSFRRNLAPDLAKLVQRDGMTIGHLRRAVSQVVIHFDACGTSKRCFEVLHDIRGLSCHFLLDLDGTIYQTLDLKERAWHAAQANDRSIGIEIAHIGAASRLADLERTYKNENGTTRIVVPDGFRGRLAADFVGTPSRPKPLHGVVNGQSLHQFDYTDEQYQALVDLLIALGRIFPRIKARVPRNDDGSVRQTAFSSDAELHKFEGLIGHHHVTTRKVDPGPAFDWERVIRAMREAGVASE